MEEFVANFLVIVSSNCFSYINSLTSEKSGSILGSYSENIKLHNVFSNQKQYFVYGKNISSSYYINDVSNITVDALESGYILDSDSNQEQYFVYGTDISGTYDINDVSNITFEGMDNTDISDRLQYLITG